jgi:hypothetical protein
MRIIKLGDGHDAGHVDDKPALLLGINHDSTVFVLCL